MEINEYERATTILEEINRLTDKLHSLISDNTSVQVGDGCRLFYNIKLNERSTSPYKKLAEKLMVVIKNDIRDEIKNLNKEFDQLGKTKTKTTRP